MKDHRYIFASATVSILLTTACQGFNWGGDGDETPTEDNPSAPPDLGDADVIEVSITEDSTYLQVATRQFVSPPDPTNSLDWDIKLLGTHFNLNGGESGQGEAWGFGPVGEGEEEYEALTDHDDVTIAFEFADEFESVMTDWYVYIVSGSSHGLYSRYHVYTIDVPGDQIYKIQVLNYYADVNGSPESGYVTFRYGPVDDETGRDVVIDATAGGSHADEDDPENKYTYFNFSTGAVVELTDDEAASSDEWHIAFKRYNVKLNGGVSGPSEVVGIDLFADREESNDEILAYSDEQIDADYTSVDSESLSGLSWSEDSIGCILQDSFIQENGQLIPSEFVFVIAGADGDSYYKFLVEKLTYDAFGNAATLQYRVAEIK